MKKLKEKYAQMEADFARILAQKQAESQKIIISKGKMFNVLPFENELWGYKLKGKEIATPIIDNDCYQYHFDAQNRVILVEEMSKFLKKFHYRTFYDYGENYIETHYWANDDLYNVSRYVFENEKVIQKIMFAKEGKSYWDYHYTGDVPDSIKISFFDKENKPIPDDNILCYYFFQYEENGNLQSIIRKDGKLSSSEIVYSTKKINFKKLETEFSQWIAANIADFSKNHADEVVSALAVLCYAGHKFVEIALETGKMEFYDSPADWHYPELATKDLPDIPFDTKDSEKLLVSVAKALNEFTTTEIFKNLNKTSDFVMTIFDHDAEHIHTQNAKIKKILKDNKYFNF